MSTSSFSTNPIVGYVYVNGGLLPLQHLTPGQLTSDVMTLSQMTSSQMTPSQLTSDVMTLSQMTSSQLTSGVMTPSQMTSSQKTQNFAPRSNAQEFVPTYISKNDDLFYSCIKDITNMMLKKFFEENEYINDLKIFENLLSVKKIDINFELGKLDIIKDLSFSSRAKIAFDARVTALIKIKNKIEKLKKEDSWEKDFKNLESSKYLKLIPMKRSSSVPMNFFQVKNINTQTNVTNVNNVIKPASAMADAMPRRNLAQENLINALSGLHKIKNDESYFSRNHIFF